MPKRILLYILCIALCAGAISACSAKETAPQTPSLQPDAPVDTAPVEPVVLPDADKILSDAFATEETPLGELLYTEIEGGVCITGYTGQGTQVRIPATASGLPVVAIGDGAFADNETLTSLVLPDTLQSIGSGILSGCTALKALRTPLLGADASKDQYLGYLFGSARFEDNPRDVPASLAVLEIGGAWETLPAYALYDCNDLTVISLPSTLRTVEKYAMSRCSSLLLVNGISSVEKFGEHALSYCESLETLSFGASVTEIGFAALEGCHKLRTLTVPFVGGSLTQNTYLGYIFGAAYPDFAMGYYSAALSRVEVLGGTELCENAFFECATLKEVVLPASLKTVGTRAFYGCRALWSVTLPDAVTTVRESAFAGCDSLLSIDLGASLSSLGINAFMNCDSLESIVLPATLNALPASAFYGCSSLSQVDLGGVESVGAQAFRGCTALTAVVMHASVSFGEGNENASKLVS